MWIFCIILWSLVSGACGCWLATEIVEKAFWKRRTNIGKIVVVLFCLFSIVGLAIAGIFAILVTPFLWFWDAFCTKK